LTLRSYLTNGSRPASQMKNYPNSNFEKQIREGFTASEIHICIGVNGLLQITKP